MKKEEVTEEIATLIEKKTNKITKFIGEEMLKISKMTEDKSGFVMASVSNSVCARLLNSHVLAIVDTDDKSRRNLSYDLAFYELTLNAVIDEIKRAVMQNLSSIVDKLKKSRDTKDS